MKTGFKFLTVLFLSALLASCAVVSSKKGGDGALDELAKPKDGGPKEDFLGLNEKSNETDSMEKSLADQKVLSEDYQKLFQALQARSEKDVHNQAALILAKDEKDLLALNALGLWYLTSGKVKAAELMFTQALEHHPNSSGLHNNLGVVAWEQNHIDEALVMFKKAYRLDDRNFSVLANLGSYYLYFGDYIKALPLLDQAQRIQRSHPKVLANYASALRENGKMKDAARVYREVIRNNPKDPELLLNFASLLIEHLGERDEGLDQINKVRFLGVSDDSQMKRLIDLENKAKTLTKK